MQVTSTTDIMLITSYFLGCLFCIILSVIDFRNHIPKSQLNNIRVIIHNVLFAIVILFFYVVFLHIIVGVTISYESPYIVTTTGSTDFKEYRIIAPILFAFFYFGASKTCIPIGGKEICLYDRTLQVFLNFLSITIDQKEINRQIKNKQVDVLQDFINKVDEKSSYFGLKGKYEKINLEKIKNDLDRESDRVKFLEDIKSKNENIIEALEKEKKKLNKVTENYMDELMLIAQRLIDSNTNNPLFSEFLIEFFKITPIEKEKKFDKVIHPIIRTVVMAIIGAFPLSAIFGTFGSQYEIITRIALIALALFSFLIWFILLPKLKPTFENNFIAIFIGIIAGFIGGMTFGFIDPKEGFIYNWIHSNILEESGESFIFSLSSLIQSIHGNQIIRGIIFGMISTFFVYFFRYNIVKRIKKILNVYFIMIISSFIFTAFLLLIWSPFSEERLTTPMEYWTFIWPDSSVMAILTVIIGLVSNVLHLEKWKLESRDSKSVKNNS